jgi:alpha-glucosidase
MTMTETGQTSLLAQPHHDGSYVLEAPDVLGGEAVVRLRIPRGAEIDGGLVRYVCDGQPRVAVAEIDEETQSETWWAARFAVENPTTNYRWLMRDANGRHRWLNGLGTFAHNVADADDFVVTVAAPGPDWHLGSVVYEIFPDRFASSGATYEAPDWAVRREWDSLPDGRWNSQYEWFGGDLPGIAQRLDHIASLGASLIYLTPIFPAGTIHRYDAVSFDHIDPLLGGDEGLVTLTRAAHERGIRIVGDLTLNHVGSGHVWFRTALEEPGSPERGFFYFDESLPNGYVSWMGVPHLPKLDHRSATLRRRMDEVVARWTRPADALDGWRIDVANMTGRYRDIDVNHEVARATRAALLAANPDGLLVAEHMHDARRDLGARGWQGVMNYSGCLLPIWSWLREGHLDDEFFDTLTSERAADEVAAEMALFRAGIPWSTVLHSWALLSSHDTPRLATVVPSRGQRLVAIGLQMTTPGVPMLFAGDEIGVEGAWGEDGRRTMPWERPETWDETLLAEYRTLIALRRSSSALARGGIRSAFVGDDAIAYLRESGDKRLLCLAARAEHEPIRLPLAELGAAGVATLYGGDAEARNGELILPADGPAFHVWRLEAH